MKGIKRKVLFLFLCVVMIVSQLSIASFAEDKETTNRFNVVFIIDESGSMENGNDPDNLRYDAAKDFIALMAETGNKVGSVSFMEDVVAYQEMTYVDGTQAKNDFAENIVYNDARGMTNIGAALGKAVELLDEGRDESLPSVIILLTDGNTEVPKEMLEESLEMKAQAIEDARTSGYQVYSIFLNCDGSGDPKELSQISTATGGEFVEVKSADSLAEVQKKYYELIFNAISEDADPIVIGDDGSATREFEVPGIGVEELNVIIKGAITSAKLTDPAGKVYEGAELDAMTMKSTVSTIVKVVTPVGGKWVATVYGEPGVEIDFQPLFNTNFYVETSATQQKEYKLGDVLEFNAVICDSTGPVTDTSKYVGFNATLTLTSGDKVIDEIEMKVGDDSFVYEYELKEEGTFYATMKVAKGDFVVEDGKVYEYSVNNTPPVAPENEIKGHANIWPFFGGKAKIDLNGAATDPDGDDITYSVESSVYTDEDYTLEDGILTVKNFSVTKGSFTIRATDSRGAHCTFDVMVTSTNIGLIMFIGLCVAAIIVVICVVLAIKKLASAPFAGTISVTKHDTQDYSYCAPSTNTPGRGQLRISTFGFGEMGLPEKCYFQAAGKEKCIYFVAKKPVYSNVTAGPAKKIKIDGMGAPVLICATQEMNKGIEVTFTSIYNNPF